MLFATQPPCFVDPENHAIQVLRTQADHEILRHLLVPQPILKSEAAELFNHLIKQPELTGLPVPPQLKQQDIHVEPVPMLTLHRDDTTNQRQYIMHLYFAYDDQYIEFYDPQNPLIEHRNEQFFSYHRKTDLEAEAKSILENLGFVGENHGDQAIFKASSGEDTQSALSHWQLFFEQHITELKAQGWVIMDNPECDFKISTASQIEVNSEDEGGWFSLSFDIEINGSQQPLVPLVSHLLTEYATLDELPEQLFLNLQDDQYININKQEISPILNTLFELYDYKSKDMLKISPFDVHLLDDGLTEINNSTIVWQGSEEVLTLAKKIKTFQGIEQVTPPKALTVALREYQETGLNWLNFLHLFKFSGILADDMGLGKTIQTLAHLSRLKEQKLLKGQSLIIVPTSLIANWKNEVNKFTPNLNVLTFYGSKRYALKKQWDDNDVIITSYALVVRDHEIHQPNNYDYIILDEAQKIKNPKTKMAQVIGRLRADYRLALSGTPIENHLGELWSIFNFLMPGFLKNLTQFKQFYQTPIEKEHDSYKQKQLNKRIKPFILRRKKEEVLDELPEKTEIIKQTQFAPAQAKLYESIRLSMEKKVRDAIANKGLNKSHITILDALLKLRQVCCDPSLLRLKEAQKVKASAKLELFLDLLDELLAEQHKVLVFSQFTSMLAILEREIKAKKIEYTKLTGASTNREKIIEEFTQGDAEVFLISLKAGGVGLNLVEADTVIHYDPWWNPAVENQATDRAHRIGQNKSVFVYKLIVENTIEEKIIALQAKKQQLQEGIYQQQEGQQEQKLTGDELIELLHD